MNKVTMSQSEGRSELSKESGTAVIANEYEELKKIVSPRNIVSLHPRVAQLSFRCVYRREHPFLPVCYYAAD